MDDQSVSMTQHRVSNTETQNRQIRTFSLMEPIKLEFCCLNGDQHLINPGYAGVYLPKLLEAVNETYMRSIKGRKSVECDREV